MGQAFVRAGLTPLIVDVRGRLLAQAPAQSLFDWPRQLERGQLLALPLGEMAAWHAPGVRVDAPGLAHAARHYNILVFDSLLPAAAVPLPGTREIALLAVQPDTMQAVYALLKTRAGAGGIEAILTGEVSSCERVREACERFLGAALAASVTCICDEDDAIATLAVRMAGEEPGCQPRYKTGNT